MADILEKETILDFLKKNKPYFEEQYKISKIGLFGSYACNKQTEKSDIDILVSMPSSFDDYYDLTEFLETHFYKKLIYCLL